jgi:hypothetical protein
VEAWCSYCCAIDCNDGGLLLGEFSFWNVDKRICGEDSFSDIMLYLMECILYKGAGSSCLIRCHSILYEWAWNEHWNLILISFETVLLINYPLENSKEINASIALSYIVVDSLFTSSWGTQVVDQFAVYTVQIRGEIIRQGLKKILGGFWPTQNLTNLSLAHDLSRALSVAMNSYQEPNFFHMYSWASWSVAIRWHGHAWHLVLVAR